MTLAVGDADARDMAELRCCCLGESGAAVDATCGGRPEGGIRDAWARAEAVTVRDVRRGRAKEGTAAAARRWEDAICRDWLLHAKAMVARREIKEEFVLICEGSACGLVQ